MKEISQELINEIRSSVDIVDVIGSYLELTPKGRNYFGICPFHDDNHPSMSVSREKQIYTCFSCHATGNVFKFLMDYENISFIEAVKKCADLANIKLDVKVSNTFINNKNSDLYEIYDNSCKFYQNLLNTNDGIEALSYLKNRAINEELIKEFKIGLSLKDRSLLTKFLVKKKYKKEDILNSGLIIENNYGINDIYCNRIMFPLEDLNGRVVGFSGRIYNTNDNSKYINTKETDIFKKREILYNYTRAKDDARSKGFVIVMEGFMDVIRAYSVGIKNVVATMGTAVTSNHAMTLKKMAKDIYLCFDGDDAGLKATVSCIEELNKVGVNPKIIRLEEDLDPDDYIKKYGKDRFIEKLDNSMNVMDFRMNYLKRKRDLSLSTDKASYVNDIINELSNIDDEVLKEITLNKLSHEADLSVEFLKDRLESLKNNKVVVKETIKEVKKTNKRLSGLEKAEIYLIYYMLNSKEVIRIYDRKISHMPTDNLRVLAREISEYYHLYEDIKLADFISYLNAYPDMLETLNNILSMDIKDDYSLEDIDGYINTINNNLIDIQIKRLRDKISASNSLDEQNAMAEKIVELKTQKN